MLKIKPKVVPILNLTGTKYNKNGKVKKLRSNTAFGAPCLSSVASGHSLHSSPNVSPA